MKGNTNFNLLYYEYMHLWILANQEHLSQKYKAAAAAAVEPLAFIEDPETVMEQSKGTYHRLGFMLMTAYLQPDWLNGCLYSARMRFFVEENGGRAQKKKPKAVALCLELLKHYSKVEEDQARVQRLKVVISLAKAI